MNDKQRLDWLEKTKASVKYRPIVDIDLLEHANVPDEIKLEFFEKPWSVAADGHIGCIGATLREAIDWARQSCEREDLALKKNPEHEYAKEIVAARRRQARRLRVVLSKLKGEKAVPHD